MLRVYRGNKFLPKSVMCIYSEIILTIIVLYIDMIEKKIREDTQIEIHIHTHTLTSKRREGGMESENFHRKLHVAFIFIAFFKGT